MAGKLCPPKEISSKNHSILGRSTEAKAATQFDNGRSYEHPVRNKHTCREY